MPIRKNAQKIQIKIQLTHQKNSPWICTTLQSCMMLFIEIEQNEVEAGLGSETKNTDFEHKFEMHVNPLSRDIK